MTENTNLQQSDSMMDYEENEVFFGPMTDRERIIKERFEKRMQEKSVVVPILSNIDIDESKNDVSENSHYESFSTESKYDSFDDSLDGAKELNPVEKDFNTKEINASNFLSEQVNINCKRLQTDKKSITGHFCDSLEDIHSLVSSGDKFSLSEEIEDINVMEISHTCEDSLRNDICIANRNSNSNEQYFDEDSLAIMEYEKAFDDSLEDSNLPSISHVDSLILSKSKVHDVDSTVEKQSTENQVIKSYFETSIDVIYENSKESSAEVKDLEPKQNSEPISESRLYIDSLEDLSELPNHNASKAVFDESIHSEIDSSSPFKSLSDDIPENKVITKSSKYMTDVDEFNSSLNRLSSRKSSTGFMKPLSELIASDNFNGTICIDDSILPSDSILNSSIAENNLKSMSNIEVSQSENNSKLLLNPLDANNTICIDDSIIASSYATACSFSTNDIGFESTTDSDHLSSMKVEKVYVKSPIPAVNKNSNDTIWIEDSIMEPSDHALSTSSNLVLDSSKEKLASMIFSKPLTAVNANNTICIDDSIISAFDSNMMKQITSPCQNIEEKNKRNSICGKHLEEDFQTLRISDVEKVHCTDIPSVNLGSPIMARSTTIDIVVRSPLHECQRNSNVTKAVIQTPEKVSTLITGSHNERNVNVHIEVAIDDGQGVNKISVSSVGQGSSEEHCGTSKEGLKHIGKERNGLGNQFKDTFSNCDVVDGRSKLNDADSVTNTLLKRKSASKKLELHFENFANQKKREQSRYSDGFHVKLHDVSLLQALDLHDTSLNISKSGPLQSRDSIMPLNLCVRDKSFERRKKSALKNESKENIPFISSTRFGSKELNIPKYQKVIDSPKKNKGTPLKNKTIKQQLKNNTEVKSSGGKVNSLTKIPIRKFDNVPLSQRKPKQDFKARCNTDKPNKSPFIVPAHPSVTPHKGVVDETPKNPHHFCMIRNSISKVPKSSQKNTTKKFQNIQSPVAKYIGNPPVHAPLKTTHRYDGNLVLSNAETLVPTLKTLKNPGFSGTPCSVKSDKKF